MSNTTVKIGIVAFVILSFALISRVPPSHRLAPTHRSGGEFRNPAVEQLMHSPHDMPHEKAGATPPMTAAPTPLRKSAPSHLAAGKGLFRVLFFCEPTRAESREMWSNFQRAKSHWPPHTVIEQIDVHNPQQQTLVKRYRAYTTPLTVVVGPEGTVTGGFTGQVSTDRVATAFVSDLTLEMMKSAAQNRVIFLYASRHLGGNTEKSLHSVRTAAHVLQDLVTVVTVNLTNGDEHDVMRRLGIDEDSRKPQVLVISPQGQVAARFVGDVSARDLMHGLQTVLAMKSGCGGSADGGARRECQM